jgi:hypothetical protein
MSYEGRWQTSGTPRNWGRPKPLTWTMTSRGLTCKHISSLMPYLSNQTRFSNQTSTFLISPRKISLDSGIFMSSSTATQRRFRASWAQLELTFLSPSLTKGGRRASATHVAAVLPFFGKKGDAHAVVF